MRRVAVGEREGGIEGRKQHSSVGRSVVSILIPAPEILPLPLHAATAVSTLINIIKGCVA